MLNKMIKMMEKAGLTISTADHLGDGKTDDYFRVASKETISWGGIYRSKETTPKMVIERVNGKFYIIVPELLIWLQK